MVKITESKLNEIINSSIKKVLKENNSRYQYSLTDLDELMEYMWLKPNITNLNVDIFVDDGGSYKRHNHILLLFARNGYDKSVSEFIPFAISNNPIIMDENIEYKITYNDIFAIQDFIQANITNLIKFATQTIDHNQFVNGLKIPSYAVITESKKMLMEMATLRMKDSDLPMDIWLDEGATYTGHAPRIKFRASNEQHSTTEFSSMLLTNPPTIENFPNNSPLKKKDIKKLEEFVINNMEALLKLANGEIDYRTQFLPNIKK